jgi:type VI secretion system protein ImpA
MIEPEALLAPISQDMPQGGDLRNPTRRPELYDAMAALRDARARERNPDPELPPDWAKVERLCAVILVGHSKDMEVAAALAEAAVRNDGFAGLAAAGEVVKGLARNHWTGLFPAPDPEEPGISAEEARLAPLRYLVDKDGRLTGGIRLQTLFKLGDGTEFTLADCARCKAWTALRPEERSRVLGALPADKRAEREKAPNGRLWGDLRAAMGSYATSLLEQTHGDAAAALQAWQGVQKAINEKAGEGSLSCQALLDLLEEVERTLGELAPASAAPAPGGGAPGDHAVAPADQNGTTGPTPTAERHLTSRNDALARLEGIAAYFRRTEPFSPVAPILEEAVRRARLSWAEWLTEAVPDKMQRDMILNRLGLRPDGG